MKQRSEGSVIPMYSKSNSRTSTSSRFLRIICALTLLFLLLLNETDVLYLPFTVQKYFYRSFVSLRASHHNDVQQVGVLPWSECLQRYPGLLENEIHIPLPDSIIHKNTYVPRQSEIPVYIIVYNNPTFVKHMVEQVDCYGSHAVLLDSGSTYPPLLEYMEQLKAGPPSRSGVPHKVIHLGSNAGPYSAFTPSMVSAMPPFFAVSDADIYFNSQLPPNFLVTLANLTRIFPGRKAGFALSLENAEKLWSFPYFAGQSIVKWESQFWTKRLHLESEIHSYAPSTEEVFSTSLDLFDAQVDTTFAVYDTAYYCTICDKAVKNRCHSLEGIRVSGPFAAEHIPWYVDFPSSWDRNEIIAAYGLSSNVSTIRKTLQKSGWLP